MADWTALARYLEDSARQRVRLTWGQLDDIVGGQIPSSASNHRAWWSGERTHVRSWTDAGYRVGDLRLGREVTFIKVVADTVRPVPPRAAPEAGLCTCGCGEQTRATYRPGHDARHAASVGRALALDESDATASAHLAAMTPSLRAKAERIRDNAVLRPRIARETIRHGSTNRPGGELAAGDSSVQRNVERLMLAALSEKLGRWVGPSRLVSPTGAAIEVDGVAADGSVLAECWAHQGPAKVAQKYKLMNDAAKLQWAATWLDPRPSRLLLCVSDEQAVRHLRGRAWQAQALMSMGVEIVVLDLPADVVQQILEAQRRQFR